MRRHVRAFHLFLKSLSPLDLTTGKPIPPHTLLGGGLADAVAVVQEGDELMRRRLANRVLVGVERGPDLLTPLRALETKSADLRNEVLRSHATPEEAWRCLLDGDDAGFIERRHVHLVERERDFIKSKGVKLPEAATAVEDESDTEDEEGSEDIS